MTQPREPNERLHDENLCPTCLNVMGDGHDGLRTSRVCLECSPPKAPEPDPETQEEREARWKREYPGLYGMTDRKFYKSCSWQERKLYFSISERERFGSDETYT